jgi:hypothetical protein
MGHTNIGIVDDRTSKYSRNKLRICVQRAAANIIVREIEPLFCVFFILSTTGEKEKLISIFPTHNQLKLA